MSKPILDVVNQKVSKKHRCVQPGEDSDTEDTGSDSDAEQIESIPLFDQEPFLSSWTILEALDGYVSRGEASEEDNIIPLDYGTDPDATVDESAMKRTTRDLTGQVWLRTIPMGKIAVQMMQPA